MVDTIRHLVGMYLKVRNERPNQGPWKGFSSAKGTMNKAVSFLFFLFSNSIASFNYEQNINKVIFSFSSLKNADIFKGSLAKPVNLSKQLIKEYNIRVKVLSNSTEFDNSELISFAFQNEDNKVTLWLFHKSYKYLISKYFK